MRDMDETVVMPARHTRNIPGRSDKDVGKRLALLRRLHNLDQDEIAEKIGVSQGTYSAWETGTRHLGINSAHAICDNYDVSLEWLYRGTKGSLEFHLENALNALKPSQQTDR